MARSNVWFLCVCCDVAISLFHFVFPEIATAHAIHKAHAMGFAMTVA